MIVIIYQYKSLIEPKIKGEFMKRSTVYACLLLNLILIVASYVLNFGWIRVFALILFIPYTIALTIINFIYVSKCSKTEFSKKSIKVLALTNGFYLLANVLMPDGADVGGTYAFFGLIKNMSNMLGNIFEFVARACLVVHFVFFALQIKEMSKMNKILK